MATRLDPLEYLEREDKWYLGGGKAAMFAPAFPRWLERFGFWDEAYFADVRLERLFTVLMLGEDERPLHLQRDGRRWTPDALTQTHTTGDGLRIREDKVVSAHDTLASRISVHNESKRGRALHLILWSLQPRNDLSNGRAATSAEEVTRAGDYITFAHRVEYGEAPYADRPAETPGWGERIRSSTPDNTRQSIHAALGADRSPVSHVVNFAENSDTSPLWQVSVVPEKLRNGKLPNEVKVESPPRHGGEGLGESYAGLLHICLHYTLEVPAGGTASIQFGAALNLDRDRALHYIQNDLRQDVAAASRASWQEYFAGVPYFECSDPYLQKYYWYRWYGLRLLTVDLSDEATDRFTHPCVFEGIGGFRSHISYSAQCHMLENGWRHDPALAYGCLENMLGSQENSGFIPGHIYLWREDRGFYHADWGANALQLYHITRDRDVLDRIYPGLSRYAEYFERDRDREDSGLFDIVDQGETGQEYMSRYLFVDESADDWRKIQLKGVDATVYIYRLQRSLAEMARVLGKETEAAVWDRKADRTRKSVQDQMWDSERNFFFDVHPDSSVNRKSKAENRKSPFKAAVGFYPFLCDIAGEEHLSAIRDHLLKPESFWTEWPVPASSVDDPYFSADAEWKGRRMSCPWNGRGWPMTNSHVCEALARAALTLDESLKPQAADLIHRFVKLMCFDGDPARPNCFEHYNPHTGTPSLYRGIDDYQHSWVVDLIVKYVAGLQPDGSDSLVLDPLPFNLTRFTLEGIRYRGHTLDIRWDSEGYWVRVDGKERVHSTERTHLEIPL